MVVNAAPGVSLTSPVDGTSAQAPATLGLGASASDSDGTVARVDFYAGNTLVGTDNSSPFTFSWSNVPAGTYAMKAVATDNRGATAMSGSRTVTVTAANSSPPCRSPRLFRATRLARRRWWP